MISQIFKYILAIFLSIIFLLNIAFYIFSNIQYQKEIERQYDALNIMTAHLSTEENYETLEIYLEHYAHINDVIIYYKDMNQNTIFSNDVDQILRNEKEVMYEGTPVGYLAVSYQNSTLGREITYGFIGLNFISITLFIIGVNVLFRYLKKENQHIISDLDNLENPNKSIKYFEIAKLQKKLIESSEQKDRQKKIYESHIGSLAHDIKTPLSVIQIYTESLKNRKLEVNNEILSDLHEEAKKIENIIPKFIKGNYIELPYLQDITLFICDYVERYREIFETKKLNVVTKLEPLSVKISDLDLGRLIEHLSFNAFYYSDDASNVFIVTSTKHRQLIVEDEGIGMNKETIEHILAGPYRTEKAIKMNEKGSGIGYQIILDIIDRNNAKVEIKSEVDKGTKVIVSFK